MTVDEFADALLQGELEFVEDGHYQNTVGRIGYRAIYRDLARFYWFSVSGTEVAFARDEVAAAIRHPEREIQREYPYLNSRGQAGFEATVRSGDHSFMLGAAPDHP